MTPDYTIVKMLPNFQEAHVRFELTTHGFRDRCSGRTELMGHEGDEIYRLPLTRCSLPTLVSLLNDNAPAVTVQSYVTYCQ